MISYTLQSKDLAELQKSLTSDELKNEVALAAGRGAAEFTREYLLDFDEKHPNKPGGTRTHFYAAAADSVSEPELSGGTASFTISKVGLAQRFYGGPIHAGVGTSFVTGNPTKYLTIPACSGAHGLPPDTFSNLRFVPRGNGHAMLVMPLLTTGSHRRRNASLRPAKSKTASRKRRTMGSVYKRRVSNPGGLVVYWLVPAVTQAPDLKVLPSEDDLQAAAAGEAGRYLSERLQ